MQILGRNLLWYAAIFGAITALKRVAFTENEVLVTDPEGAMSMVVDHTHYMPKRWRGKESTEMVRHEFKTLFQVLRTILCCHSLHYKKNRFEILRYYLC